MELFKCNKTVHAEPMTDKAYRELHFKQHSSVKMVLPLYDMGKPEQQGYHVVYSKGSDDHYESWSPKKAFEEGYMSEQEYIAEVENHARALAIGSFGWAVERMKQGAKVARRGWNGSGMFAYYVPANSYPADRGANVHGIFENDMVPYRHYLALKTAQNDVATWSPSTSDALADDWEEVE